MNNTFLLLTYLLVCIDGFKMTMYNKLPNNDYNLVTSLKKTLNIVKDIHNVVFADENDDYMFISLHLKNLFGFLKNIILQSNILD